jgi:hypothetical protein
MAVLLSESGSLAAKVQQRQLPPERDILGDEACAVGEK